MRECILLNKSRFWEMKVDNKAFYFIGKDLAEHLATVHKAAGYNVTIDYEYYKQFN